MIACRAFLWSAVCAMLLVGCTATPSRMDAYLGPAHDGQLARSSAAQAVSSETPLKAGLIVINDTSAEEAAPSLSASMMEMLTNLFAQRLEATGSIKVVKTFPAGTVTPQGNVDAFINQAAGNGFEYLVVGIISSSEAEIPTYLPLSGVIQGGGRGPTVPGYRARNLSRVEVALVHLPTKQSVLRVDGQAYADLYRLNVPIEESNAFPVIFRSQLVNPIFPSETLAHDTLRGVAGDDAIKQAMMHFRQHWKQRMAS